jgi:hypothetical protein
VDLRKELHSRIDDPRLPRDAPLQLVAAYYARTLRHTPLAVRAALVDTPFFALLAKVLDGNPGSDMVTAVCLLITAFLSDAATRDAPAVFADSAAVCKVPTELTQRLLSYVTSEISHLTNDVLSALICLVRLRIGMQTVGDRQAVYVALLDYVQVGTRDELIVGWMVVLLRETIRSGQTEAADAAVSSPDFAWLEDREFSQLLTDVYNTAESDYLRLLVCDCFFTHRRFHPPSSESLSAILQFLLRTAGDHAILAPTALSIVVVAVETQPAAAPSELSSLVGDNWLKRFASLLHALPSTAQPQLRSLLSVHKLPREVSPHHSLPAPPSVPFHLSALLVPSFDSDSHSSSSSSSSSSPLPSSSPHHSSSSSFAPPFVSTPPSPPSLTSLPLSLSPPASASPDLSYASFCNLLPHDYVV